MKPHWRQVLAVGLLAIAAWTAYAVVVAVVEGTRGSNAALYWASTALLVMIGLIAMRAALRLLRQRIRS